MIQRYAIYSYIPKILRKNCISCILCVPRLREYCLASLSRALLRGLYRHPGGFPYNNIGDSPFRLGKTNLTPRNLVVPLPAKKETNMSNRVPDSITNTGIMKKSIIVSSMVVVMSMISTTGFAKVVKNQPHVPVPRPELIVVKHDHCPHHAVRPHRHDFNRHHECKVCHLTKHQIKKMEKEMRKHHAHVAHR